MVERVKYTSTEIPLFDKRGNLFMNKESSLIPNKINL